MGSTARNGGGGPVGPDRGPARGGWGGRSAGVIRRRLHGWAGWAGGVDRHAPPRAANLARCTAALLLLACTAPATESSICDAPRRTGTLPDAVDESSGVAASRRHPGVFWTHNDSGDGAFVFAIDSAGRLLGRVRVTGAENHDWEDISVAPCGNGSGDCLYIADTGDNQGVREEIAVYRVPEPAPDDSATAPAVRLAMSYPDGGVDTEAIYILPDGAIHLISKGRHAPPTIYRYPGPPRTDEVVELREVGRLAPATVALPYQITGADASRDGRWVAVRTYTAVQLYRIAWRGRLRPVLPGDGIDLQTLAEPQGEAVAFAPDGSLFLTSEAGPNGVPGTIARVDCRLD